MTQRVSQAILQKPLTQLDPAGFIVGLPPCPWTEEEIAKLERFLLRSGELVCKLPNPPRAAKRDIFVQTVLAHVVSLGQPESIERIRGVFEVQAIVQSGYTTLRAALDTAPTRSRPPEEQAAIALARISDYGDIMRRDAETARSDPAEPLNLNNEALGIDETGQPYSIDGVTGALLADLRLVLVMLGHEASWFDAHGTLQLPTGIDLSGALSEQGQPVQVLAAFWRRWERLEQRRRYWGGDWKIVPLTLNGRLTGPQVPEVLVYQGPDEELFDWAANARSKEVSIQAFARSLIGGLKVGPGKGGPDAPPLPLAPAAAIREHEVNGAAYLANVLGQNIVDDQRQFAGLRLVEWLRGYAALGLFADDAIDAQTSLDRHLLSFDPGALQRRLEQAGLAPEAAAIFLGHASLNAKAHDLFDMPIIAREDGGHLLVGLACVNADPGKVTLSRLTQLKAAPSDKGDLFEAAVHELLHLHGLSSFTIDTIRDEEPYELDVVVPWGKYLFVIECKNRGLSDGDPISGRYFLDEVEEFVEQVERQVAGLKKHPDMAIAAGGVDPNDYEVVPVILFSEPFALPEGVNGTYVSDWSTLTRFFTERHFFSVQPHNIDGRIRFLHRIALYDQWNADIPSPEALLRILREAPQTLYMLSRAEYREEKFPISNLLGVATDEAFKGDVNLDRMAELFGFDPSWVESERVRVAGEVEKIRDRVAKAKNQPSDDDQTET